VECKIRGQFKIHGLKSTNPLAVGDRVGFILGEGQQTGVIMKIHERKNYIIRKATNLSKVYHVIAANMDQAFLVVTVAQPRTHLAFIDRFLTTAEAYHIPAALVINKTDLYEGELQERFQDLKDLYAGIGYPVYPVSAMTGENVNALKELMRGKVTLFSGHSGVGKSALLNCLEPGLDLKVKAISAYHQSGTHTTTFAEMHELSFGGYVIDTPGIREFGLSDFRKEEVAERFPEFRALMDQCQFNNCTHTHEPRCAVKEALASGHISKSRYRNYLGIIHDEELEENDWE
jgi:ribosome biogenesis GTPase